jgi:hypothetical protein
MRRINAIAAAGATLCLAGAAHAQLTTKTDVTPYNIAVRLGVDLPFDTALSNFGNPLYDVAIEYTAGASLLPGGDTYFSLDYFGKDFKFDGGVFPICINQRFYVHNQNRGRRVYAFVGVGAAVVEVGHSDTDIAARGGLGTDLGDNIFFEIAATISDKGENGATADSVGFSVGYRF